MTIEDVRGEISTPQNIGTGGSQLMFTQTERKTPQRNSTGEGSSSDQEYGSGTSDQGRGEWGERGRGKSDRDDNYAMRQEGAGGTGSNSRDKSHIKYFNCGKMGHYASKCCSKRRNNERQYTYAALDEPGLLFSISQEKTRAKQQEAIKLIEEMVVKVFHQGEVKTTTKDIWYLDNGARNHMTGQREMYQELDEKITGDVRLGDDNVVQIMDKGKVMTENGSKVNMVGDAIKVYDNGKLLMFVKRTSNRLYKISLELAKPICLLASFEKPEGVAVATKSADGAGCSSPTTGEVSLSTSTLRIPLPAPETNNGKVW
ncbi:hypothetical protein AKJ16_DCAP27030 [Drosera capensis]